MKKILLAVLLLLLFALPVSADAPVSVVVNGKLLDTPGLLINGSTYVPLRAVSEGLGAKVDWDGSRAIVETAAVETMGEPKIIGDATQKARIEAALQLLKEKDPPDYELVCRHVKDIFVSKNDSAIGFSAVPINATSESGFLSTIFLTPSLFNDYDNIYIASTIVHEATHLCTARHYDGANKKRDENIAYLQGITVLRILGASQQVIDGTEQTRLKVIK